MKSLVKTLIRGVNEFRFFMVAKLIFVLLYEDISKAKRWIEKCSLVRVNPNVI